MSDWYPSGSEEDNDSFFSSTESSEEEDKEEVQPSIHPDYLDLMDSGEDSENEKRIIRSAKAKRWEELKKITTNLQNKRKINDWTAILEEWHAMTKCLDKAKNVINEHGVPRFLVAAFLQLEDFINETGSNKELTKNMKKQNSQSFNAVKQRFKKYLEAEEYGIKTKMTEWRESEEDYEGDDFDEEEEEEVIKKEDLFESDSGEGEAPKEKKKSADLRDADEKWNQEKIDKKVKEMLGKRGTKAYDKRQHERDFVFLKEKSEGLNNKLVIDFHILNVLHDMIPATSAISLKLWTKTYNMLVSLLDQFFNEPALKLYETKDEFQADFGAEAEITSLPPNVVVGHLLHSLEKLGDEYTSALQATEAPSENYIVWLSHENPLLRLYEYAKKFYMEKGDFKRATIVAQKIMHFISYRHETAEKGQPDPASPVLDISSNAIAEDEEGNPIAVPDEVEEAVVLRPPASIKDDWNIEQVVPALCSFICQHHPEDRQKRPSILELVYHYAIHDKFFEARDLLLMTHLQEKIHKAKPSLQVLFNRANIQLGLAAFRQGRIQDAHNCLQEICSSQRIKELLAQGINVRYQGEKTKEQEKSEQRRQIPYHMHINLDLVEFVHLTCAMLLEVPNMAQSRDREHRRKIVSKYFVKIMEYYDRQVFTGPPESARETILVAAKSLEKGDWKACKHLIASLPVLQLFPNKDAIIEMLGKEIQEQGLKTYLFAYGQYYDSLSLDQLCSMFSLDEKVAHAIISKLIISEELAASWDQPTGALLIHTHDPTPLQLQALSYADKINILLESVDGSEQRTFDHRRMASQITSSTQTQSAQQQKKTTPTVTGASPATAAQRKPATTTASKLAMSGERGFTTRDRRAKKAGAFNKK